MLYEKALSGDIKAVQFYLKTQGGWTEKSYIELSKAEVPIDTHWTVNVVDTSICRNCDQVRSDESKSFTGFDPQTIQE